MFSPTFWRTLCPGSASEPLGCAVIRFVFNSARTTVPKRLERARLTRWCQSCRPRVRLSLSATTFPWRGWTPSHLDISLAAPLSTAQHPLSASLTTVKHWKARENTQLLAKCQGRVYSQHPVNTNKRQDTGRRFMRNRVTKAYKPTVRIKVDCRVVSPALVRKAWGIPITHPADFGRATLGLCGIQLAGFDLSLLKAERIFAPLLTGAGETGNAVDPVLTGPVESAQSLSLASWGDIADPVILGPNVGQFTGLTDVGNMLSFYAMEAPSMLLEFLQGNSVNHAVYPCELTELFFICSCWMQSGLSHTQYLTALGGRRGYAGVKFLAHFMVSTMFGTTKAQSVLRSKRLNAERGNVLVYILIHPLLISYPRKMALSKLVNSFKGSSNRLLRTARPKITGRNCKGVLGSPDYFFASCGGAHFSVVAKYVNSQREAAKSRSHIPPRPKRQDIQRGFR